MKWKYGAQSPVLLFIDDLSNSYLDVAPNSHGYLEGDYGHLLNQEGSAYSFLMNEVLGEFPEVKITFFTVTGEYRSIIERPRIRRISFPLNASPESTAFFRSVHESPRSELAYHGTVHNRYDPLTRKIVPEWLSYRSLNEAIAHTREGIEIFRQTLGVHPRGGKYCAYRSNEFSDLSVDKTGFLWWCRHYNRATATNMIETSPAMLGNDPTRELSIKFFGQRNVIDIPTTLPGSLLNSHFTATGGIKGVVGRLTRATVREWKLKQVDYLLKHNLVISIQEHISPIKADGTRQNPNIFDDRESLQLILRYLRDKNVWYCTGSELADWVVANSSCTEKKESAVLR